MLLYTSFALVPLSLTGGKKRAICGARKVQFLQKLSALTAKKLSEPFANAIRRFPYARNAMQSTWHCPTTQIKRILISILEKRNLELVTDCIALFISLFFMGIFAPYVCF